MARQPGGHRVSRAADHAVVRQAVDLLVVGGVHARHGAHVDPGRLQGASAACLAPWRWVSRRNTPSCPSSAGWWRDRCALEPGLAVGIILVASCPGGMASNLISYLARANLALSVVLTLCSTMLAFVFTPLWTSLLAGKYVPVDAWGLCLSALQLTVAPVALGVLIRWKLPRTADRIGACGPDGGRAGLRARHRRDRGGQCGRHRGELRPARCSRPLRCTSSASRSAMSEQGCCAIPSPWLAR